MSDAFRSLDVIAQEIQAAPAPNALHNLALNLVKAARRALAQIETPGEVVELRNKVRALEVYAKRQRATLADSNLISAERLRIERTIGEMLKESVDHRGGKIASHDGRQLPNGITWNDSSRWQKLADVDEADFEMWLAECLEKEEEISTAAALGLWSRFVQPEHAPTDDALPADAPDLDEWSDDDPKIHEIFCPHCGAAIQLSAAAQVMA